MGPDATFHPVEMIEGGKKEKQSSSMFQLRAAFTLRANTARVVRVDQEMSREMIFVGRWRYEGEKRKLSWNGEGRERDGTLNRSQR